MSDINYMDIKEFHEKGFLQEANRQFFHPLGLALEISIDEETGEFSLGGVWDYRDDPEGMVFEDETLTTDVALEKAESVQAEWLKHQQYRVTLIGSVVQKIPGFFQIRRP